MLLNDLVQEQEFCGYIADEKKRCRALANIIALKSAIAFFKDCGLNPSVGNAAHRIKKVFEDIDISDLYIGELRLDVRLGMMRGEYLIPRNHYELGITPDLYMFVDYDKNSGKTEISGFIEPDNVDKTNCDDYYYFIPKTSVAPVDTLEPLFDSLALKAKNGLPLNCKKKCILYLDNQLLDTKEFYQDLMNYEKARRMLLEYVEAEGLLKSCSLSLPDKSNELLELASEDGKKSLVTSDELDLGFADGLAEYASNDVVSLDSFIAGDDTIENDAALELSQSDKVPSEEDINQTSGKEKVMDGPLFNSDNDIPVSDVNTGVGAVNILQEKSANEPDLLSGQKSEDEKKYDEEAISELEIVEETLQAPEKSFGEDDISLDIAAGEESELSKTDNSEVETMDLYSIDLPDSESAGTDLTEPKKEENNLLDFVDLPLDREDGQNILTDASDEAVLDLSPVVGVEKIEEVTNMVHTENVAGELPSAADIYSEGTTIIGEDLPEQEVISEENVSDENTLLQDTDTDLAVEELSENDEVDALEEEAVEELVEADTSLEEPEHDFETSLPETDDNIPVEELSENDEVDALEEEAVEELVEADTSLEEPEHDFEMSLPETGDDLAVEELSENDEVDALEEEAVEELVETDTSVEVNGFNSVSEEPALSFAADAVPDVDKLYTDNDAGSFPQKQSEINNDFELKFADEASNSDTHADMPLIEEIKNTEADFKLSDDIEPVELNNVQLNDVEEPMSEISEDLELSIEETSEDMLDDIEAVVPVGTDEELSLDVTETGGNDFSLTNDSTDVDGNLLPEDADGSTSGLSFSEFASDIESINKKVEAADTDEDKEYDPDYVPDFAAGEFKLEGEDNSNEEVLSKADDTTVEELDNELEKELGAVDTAVSEPAGIDIQAAMEGFVNSMAPDESIATVPITPNNTAESNDDIADALDPDTVPEEERVEQQLTNGAGEVQEQNEEIDELYTDEASEPEFEHSVPYKKKKKSPVGLLGGIFVLLIALGAVGFVNKDLILSKIQGSAPVESVPSELAATPVEKAVVQQPKKDELETEAEAMLDDIEEPVQLLDTSVSISAMTVDCDVPSYMVNTHSRRYLVKLAKRMQLQLKNALLIAGEQPLANKIVIDLSVDKDVLKYEKISSSSGSKKVDEIAASTTQLVLKNTQPYAGTFGKNQGVVKLVVKF